MSIRTAAHFCAICDRERKAVVGTPETPLDLGALGAAKASTKSRHKYGHLPSKKTDDFIQVTEPQWLRRGNLKESDSVCKRHLAILMRGVDRGCEGGCCSPLHRGARLCRAGSLKAIPPTWRRRFVKHPKIKDKDKDLMMFCWECYKKHMGRMSKYGDPMGRTFGKQNGIQRSTSLADPDESGTTILQAMKRYKSMEKLDLDNVTPSATEKSEERRGSSSSSSPRYNGNLSNKSKTPDAEIRPTPSRRTSRGRRSHKSKRSPSPPNNISPVRTSVVHSKRKHSPHKSPKSPSAWRSEITATTIIEAQCNTPALSPRNSTRLSIDEGALADTESPRGPPIPPPGLFSLRIKPSGDVFDVFETRTNPLGSEASTLESAVAPPNTQQIYDGGVLPQRDMTPEVSGHSTLPRISPDVSTAVSRDTIHVNNKGFEVYLTESRVQEELETVMQAEESTTSADEMAAIFANQNLHDPDTLSDYVDETNKYPGQAAGDIQTAEIVEFSDLSELSDNIVASHQHESSESSSDKTGDTQIERNIYITPEKVTIHRGSPYHSESQDLVNVDDVEVPQKANGVLTTSDNQSPRDLNDVLGEEPAEDGNQKQKTAISSSDFTNSVFVSPTRNNQEETTPVSASTVNYSLSPQSFRRLESMRLQFEEESFATEDDKRRKLFFDDDVRNKSHPMRNHVLLKVPRELYGGTLMHSYIRLPAEDVEIFPDALSFLDGITQTVGEDMTMYAQDGVWMAKVDLNHGENRKAHRTSQFSDDLLVVRRGQPFEIFLELSEKYDEGKHKIMAELMIGDSPRVSNGTHLFLPIQHNGTTLFSTTYNLNAGGQWSGRLTDTLDKRLKISLTPPSTCSIGSYKLYFQVERDGVRSRWQSSSENDRKVIVVFNPWNIDDAVFMSSQADRQEYVVSDAGCIYSGNKANIIRVPWIFGQYEPGVLQACVTLVESSGLPSTKLGDPVAVAKAICRTLTASLPPNTNMRKRGLNLSSGAEILRRFLETGVLFTPSDNKALSGLLVTALRCVGLPSRPVTCLNCALETDLPMNVNVHYTQQGNSLDYMNRDRVWPSYTWAGVWMSRLDLPPGFGGWQAFLPPTSNRECAGPLPAYGIKKGQTSCCEGTQEHFVSLNADKKSWIVWQDGNMTLAATDRGFAGTALMTKSVGSLEPQDVTKLYKFNEGCEEHKLAVHTACMHNGSQKIYEEPHEPEPFLISLATNPEIINLGNDATLMATIKNSTNSEKHLTVHLDVAVLAEDGTAVVKVQRETVPADVLANKSVEIPVTLKLAPCLHKLTQHHHLSMTAFGSVRDMESHHVIATHLAGIKYPDIELQLRGEFKVGGEVTVLSRMRNPLPYALTNAKISLNTSGLIPLESITSNTGKSVGPWQVYKCERVYRCQRPGKHTVIASFLSDQLNGPTGMQEIVIS